MKKFIETVAIIKSIAGMVFAGQVILFVVIGSFFGLSSISFSFIWQALAIALITGVLQFVAFTEAVIKRIKYSLRLVIFAMPLFIILAFFAVLFHWFPLSIGAWLTFSMIFLFVFGAITAVFELYSRITGKRYNEKLNAYRHKSE